MAGLGGLGAALGGYTEARHRKYTDNLAAKQAEDAAKESTRQFDITAHDRETQNAALLSERQARDLITQKNLEEKTREFNEKRDALDPLSQAKIDHYKSLNGLEAANAHLDGIRGGYIQNDLGPLTAARTQGVQATTQLTNARTHYIAETQPAEFNAKLQEGYAAIASRKDIAGMNNDARASVARMYAAARLQAVDTRDAMEMALKQYAEENANARAAMGDRTRVFTSQNQQSFGQTPGPDLTVPKVKLNAPSPNGNGVAEYEKMLLDAGKKNLPSANPANPKNASLASPAVRPPLAGVDDPAVKAMISAIDLHPGYDVEKALAKAQAQPMGSRAYLSPQQAQIIRAEIAGSRRRAPAGAATPLSPFLNLPAP